MLIQSASYHFCARLHNVCLEHNLHRADSVPRLQHNQSRLVTTKECHDDWWYDPAAILSRKPSVRFRRSVNIVQPIYDDEVRFPTSLQQSCAVQLLWVCCVQHYCSTWCLINQ